LDGFLTSKTQVSDLTHYSYSSRGELLRVYLPDGRLIEYVTDPLGRRIAKKVDGVVTDKYLWQGLTRLLALYDGSDNLVMRFEYADARMPVAMTKSGTTYYLIYDQVGSLRIVSDASGNVVKRIDYDSFGSIINDTNPGFTVPFGFAGGLHDQDVGLVRFGFRDYDPEVGRWTAKDPILFKGNDIDLYGYCLRDPVNSVDSDGRLFLTWHFGITYAAARSSGMGIGESIALAFNAAAVDIGTQGIEPEQTNLHAMAGRGQSPEEAINATKKLINDPCSSTAKRIHAAQDLATPAHAGSPWPGFHFDLDTAKHVFGDFVPSDQTIQQAYANTIYALGGGGELGVPGGSNRGR
jgi:RHS repeat-associated protein